MSSNQCRGRSAVFVVALLATVSAPAQDPARPLVVHGRRLSSWFDELRSPDPRYVHRALAALQGVGPPAGAARDTLTRLIEERACACRARHAVPISAIRAEIGGDALADRLFRRSSPQLVGALAWGDVGDPRVTSLLLSDLRKGSREFQLESTYQALETRDFPRDDLLDALSVQCKDAWHLKPRVSRVIAELVGRPTDEFARSLGALARYSRRDESFDVVSIARRLVAADESLIEELRRDLTSESPSCRQRAVLGLAIIGEPASRARPDLRSQLERTPKRA